MEELKCDGCKNEDWEDLGTFLFMCLDCKHANPFVAIFSGYVYSCQLLILNLIT